MGDGRFISWYFLEDRLYVALFGRPVLCIFLSTYAAYAASEEKLLTHATSEKLSTAAPKTPGALSANSGTGRAGDGYPPTATCGTEAVESRFPG
jgi:hypothetical protein